MTLTNLRDRIWAILGKPTDIDPSVDATELNFFVNEAQRQIAFWKDPITGKSPKIESLVASTNYRTRTVSDTVAAVNNTTFPYYVDLTSVDNNADDIDRYNDWTICINSEYVGISDYDESNRRCYLIEEFNTTPSVSDSVVLYKNFDFLLPSTHGWVGEHIQNPPTNDRFLAGGNIFQILSIVDTTNGRALDHVSDTERYPVRNLSQGDPGKWWRVGNRIYYDVLLTNDLWFTMEYYRMPLDMSQATDEPELPETFHYAIILHGVWQGLKRSGEISASKLTWSDLGEYMRTVLNEEDVKNLRERRRGHVVYK